MNKKKVDQVILYLYEKRHQPSIINLDKIYVVCVFCKYHILGAQKRISNNIYIKIIVIKKRNKKRRKVSNPGTAELAKKYC